MSAEPAGKSARSMFALQGENLMQPLQACMLKHLPLRALVALRQTCRAIRQLVDDDTGLLWLQHARQLRIAEQLLPSQPQHGPAVHAVLRSQACQVSRLLQTIANCRVHGKLSMRQHLLSPVDLICPAVLTNGVNPCMRQAKGCNCLHSHFSIIVICSQGWATQPQHWLCYSKTNQTCTSPKNIFRRFLSQRSAWESAPWHDCRLLKVRKVLCLIVCASDAWLWLQLKLELKSFENISQNVHVAL